MRTAQMLRDLGGPVDFALNEGWPNGQGQSLAREVIEILAPQIRTGGYVVNDNAEPDFLQFIRDPANGFIFCEPAAYRGSNRTLRESLLECPRCGCWSRFRLVGCLSGNCHLINRRVAHPSQNEGARS